MIREQQPTRIDPEAVMTALGTICDRQRYGDLEKALLAQVVENEWQRIEFDWERAVVVGRLPFISPGDVFNEDEPKSGLPTEVYQQFLTAREESDRMVFFQMLESEGEVGQLVDLLIRHPINSGILVTSFVPGSRMDRAVDNWHGQALNPSWRRHFRGLRSVGIEAMVMVDCHSPGIVQMAMEEGVAVLDLSAARLEFRGFGERLARLNGDGKLLRFDWAVEYADDGSSEVGKSVRRLVAEERSVGEREVLLLGGKKSKDKGTQVNFSPEDLKSVKGKVVIFPDDILSSGGTLVGGISKVLAAGSEHVVVLVTHPLCLPGSVENIKQFGDKVTLVTTNGRTSFESLDELETLVRVDVVAALEMVVAMERQGVDWWNKEGQAVLKQIGFDLNPWQTEHKELLQNGVW